MYACRFRNETLALKLIGDKNGQINEEGYTPLMLACRYDLRKVVQALLSKTCRPDAVSLKGESALFISLINKTPFPLTNRYH